MMLHWISPVRWLAVMVVAALTVSAGAQELPKIVAAMGWFIMGTQRGAYYYGTGGNGAQGSMSSVAWAFDMIAKDLDPGLRQRVIDGFFLPAAMQARNHYIGDGNQQAKADLTAMWGGLLARNWPLVSFGYSSEHGYKGILEWAFDDDGVQLRKNYQSYTMQPIFWINELFYGAGLNLYERHEERLRQIINADPQAKNMGGSYKDSGFWNWAAKTRLD